MNLVTSLVTNHEATKGTKNHEESPEHECVRLGRRWRPAWKRGWHALPARSAGRPVERIFVCFVIFVVAFDKCSHENQRAQRTSAVAVEVGLGVGSYEKPIQRPAAATPNHSVNDTSATSLFACTPRVSCAVVTFRRTVNVKRIARGRAVIFTQNAGL